MSQPNLLTSRLCLRPFTQADVPRVYEIIAQRGVVDGSLLIPYPCPAGLVENWIGAHQREWENGNGIYYAITRRDDGTVLGSINLEVKKEPQPGQRKKRLNGTLGYWLDEAYWGLGLMSEAVEAFLAQSFNEPGIDRIEANHLTENPASGRVMVKNGLQYTHTKIGYEPDNLPHELQYYAIDREFYLQWAQDRQYRALDNVA